MFFAITSGIKCILFVCLFVVAVGMRAVECLGYGLVCGFRVPFYVFPPFSVLFTLVCMFPCVYVCLCVCLSVLLLFELAACFCSFCLFVCLLSFLCLICFI